MNSFIVECFFFMRLLVEVSIIWFSFRCWKNSRNFQVEVEFLPVRFYNFEIIPDSESEICTVGCDESDRSKPRRENPRQKEKHYTQYTQSVIVDVDIWNILTNIEHI